ncbi:PEP-CTERM sorting domain-containing protein [Massilia arenae]|uniref:PEP-CTERM sorting domain-containing protein n=2 Tax=Massilia arenae TaxID=2603288 RepID=A0A5C7G116_9BURK|nr:PEP-CTERM sorting domain-containing protein [Massilia arenae]
MMAMVIANWKLACITITIHFQRNLLMNNTIRAAIVSGFLLVGAALPAHAAIIKFNLDGVTFTDNTVATGFVNFDTKAHRFLDYAISTQQGVLSAFDYNGTNSQLYDYSIYGPSHFMVMTNDNRRYFIIALLTSLNATDASFALHKLSTYECNNCGTVRRVTSGSLTNAAAEVPEPATAALLLPALGALAWMSRRRTKPANRAASVS